MMVQTIVPSLVSDCFIYWFIPKGNEGLQKVLLAIQNQEISALDMGLWLFGILLIINGTISLVTYIFMSKIKDKKLNYKSK